MGLNKVNPILENIRNMEQLEERKTQLKFKNKIDSWTGEERGGEPELLVKEEVSPTKLKRRPVRTVEEFAIGPSRITEERKVSQSPTKFVQQRKISSSPQKKMIVTRDHDYSPTKKITVTDNDGLNLRRSNSREKKYIFNDNYDNDNDNMYQGEYVSRGDYNSRYTTTSKPNFEVIVKKSNANTEDYYSRNPYESAPNNGLRMSFNEFEKKYNQFEGFKRGLPSNIDDNEAFQMFLEHLDRIRSPTKISSRSPNVARTSKSPGSRLSYNQRKSYYE